MGGPATTRALVVNGSRTGSGPGMAAIRELERLGTVGSLLGDQRVVVGQLGGLAPLARRIVQSLRRHGAIVIAVDDPDPAIQAHVANRFGATVYLGLESRLEPGADIAYYATHAFQSAGGRALANRIAVALRGRLEAPEPEVTGTRSTALRETRMTAVVCSLGPVQPVIDGAALLSECLVGAVSEWAGSPSMAAAPTS